ncbi:MAG: choice-of-anchor D domain-containing protein [Verrucomicrobiota bacterium]
MKLPPSAAWLYPLVLLKPLPLLAAQLELSPPAGSGRFGGSVAVLANGNFVVTDPGYDAPGPVTDAGAVYLYDGGTLNIISRLTGSAANDRVGTSVTALSNGNFLVVSSTWDEGKGALTWVNGTTGLTGVISADNSLIGAGTPVITELSNGNYVALGPQSATWGSGTGGAAGEITAANSLINIGPLPVQTPSSQPLVIPLANGNYVVRNPSWNAGTGFMAWGNGTTGVKGTVSFRNALIGSDINNTVGSRITLLGNGNFLVGSPGWNNRGAVTWVNGTVGLTGFVSGSNSLTGISGDNLGGGAPETTITVLNNGNYLVKHYRSTETVTWGSGTAGVTGEISAANSLVNTGNASITLLNNGNYVICNPFWPDSQNRRGAVALADGATGLRGAMSAENSLVGTFPEDRVGSGNPNGATGVTALSNGNFVVHSPRWNGNRGAVTWVSGTLGLKGEISAANSLIGGEEGSLTGDGGIIPLTNGNYLVSTLQTYYGDDPDGGSVTWGSGTAGVAGAVSAANSLLGTSASGDFYGLQNPNYKAPGITALSNGNYVVCSPYWNFRRGAVVWGNGASGVKGKISAVNALVGATAGEQLGAGGATALSTGNYLVKTPGWNSLKGALTFGNGATGLTGAVSASNSLTGTSANDLLDSTVTPLPNGDYLLGSPKWNSGKGAVTWGSGLTGVTGEISGANSLIGTRASDRVGENQPVAAFITPLSSGNYLIGSPYWNGNRGAVTLGRGGSSVTGEITDANSLVGTAAYEYFGLSSGIKLLANGNFVIFNPAWSGNKGSLTWGSGTAGVTGTVSAANSLVGNAEYDIGVRPPRFPTPSQLSFTFPVTGDYIMVDLSWGYGRGIAILGDGERGTRGLLGNDNSFEGGGGGGSTMKTVYDPVRSRLIVGYPVSSRVALITYDPSMAVSAGGVAVPDGGTSPQPGNGTDFGITAAGGGTVVRNFTISNSNPVPLNLTGTPKVTVTGANAGDFTVTGQPEAVVPASGGTTFQITFAPAAAGLRTAMVSIPGDDPHAGVYQFAIQGTGSSAGTSILDNWRTTWFGGATAGTGNLEDFEGDGISNLLEFAMNTVPTSGSSGAASLEYTGTAAGGGILKATGQPVLLPGNEGLLGLYVRRKDYAEAGLTYAPQFSSDLITWTDIAAIPVVMADNGADQILSVPCPPPSAGKTNQFFRVKVTIAP